MPRIIDKRSDVAVVVVGIVYDERFLRRAEELGVDDHLFAIGGVPKEVVPDYLAAAQLEAHDLQGYGLGTASLETMAAGVPVVATVRDDNFLGMQLHSGKELVMVPERDPAALASAIVELLDNQELATRVGLGGRRLVEERFTLDAVTRQHLELYERLAAEGAAPR